VDPQPTGMDVKEDGSAAVDLNVPGVLSVQQTHITTPARFSGGPVFLIFPRGPLASAKAYVEAGDGLHRF